MEETFRIFISEGTCANVGFGFGGKVSLTMGLLGNRGKKRRFCAVAINVSEDEVQFLLAIQFTEKTVFQPRVLDRMLVEACLNQEERLALHWTTETVPACSSSI